MVDFEKIPYAVVKGLLPYMTLAAVKKIGKGTVYNILAYIEKEFNTHIPSATMYGVIYSLERKGYIQIVEGKNYGLTEKGFMLLKKAGEVINGFSPKIEALLEN